MSLMRRTRRLLDAMLGRGRFEREMAEEMAHHLELEVQDRIAAGMTPAEARRTALRDFGGVERWKEASRAARGLTWWDATRQDLRYAARSLRGSPGFAAVAVATLALGIGATTAVFSVVDGLLLKPLGYDAPDRIVRLFEYGEDGGGRGTISSPNFYDWMEQSTVFETGALYDEYWPTLTVGGEAIRLEAASVGAAYFDVLGVRPAVGRFFLPEEEAPGSARVVLGWGLWQAAFGADPDVVGRDLDLSGFPYTVVGVAPPMEDPRLSGATAESPALWRSTPSYFATNGRSGRSFTALARLRPGVTLEGAREELSTIHARLVAAFPEENAGRVVRVEPLLDDLVGEMRPVLWLLAAAVALVLLVACANVANLLLFRAAFRGREIGLRTALGATRGRVVRQLMVESLLLATLGAAGGILIALATTRGLVALAAGHLPRVESVALDLRVLTFAAAASVVAALLFGLLPALHTTRVDVRGALGEGSQASGTGPAQGRLRSAVVAAQVAMAVVVMLGAGVLGRSLLLLRAVDPGVAVDRTAVLRISPPPDRYGPSAEDGQVALMALYQSLEERLGGLPGVEAVGLTDLLPMSGSFNGNVFSVVGRPEPRPGELPSAETRAVSAGYLGAMAISLIEGRGILASDDGASERVIVLSESFARQHFTLGDAVGAEIRIFDPAAPPARVVGVAGDVRQFTLDQPPEPVVYVPLAQAPAYMQRDPWIVLRTAGAPSTALADAREVIRGVEPRAPIYGEGPMSAVVARTLARPRFRASLLLAFAGVAFLLAATGVYAMMAYTVARRTPEIGLRMALGADRGRVLRHVIGQGLRPVLLGVAGGVGAGLLAVRLLAGFLYGVAPTDLVTFALVPLALVAVAALAAWLPARRAARLTPASVLRAG